jgi:hypothetical protein
MKDAFTQFANEKRQAIRRRMRVSSGVFRHINRLLPGWKFAARWI